MFGLFNKVKDFFKENEIYARTYRELSAMSDRDLNDIGITRGDIEFIAAQAAKEVTYNGALNVSVS